MRYRTWLVGMALVLACSTPARAQQGAQKEDRRAEAKVQFQLGRDALKRGEMERARILFKLSHELNPIPSTLGSLAICEEKLGLVASAWQHFEELAAQLPAGDDRLPFAKERAAALKPLVPKLRLELVPGTPPGTTLALSGELIAAADLGQDRPLDPGSYTVLVTSPGRRDRLYRVGLEAGQRKRLRAEAGTIKAVIVPKRRPLWKPPEPEPSGLRTAGFVLGGIGVLGLGAGTVTGILALGKKNEVEALCPEPKRCTREGVAIESTGKGFATASTVSFAAGLGMLGLGTTLVLVGNAERSTEVGAAVLPGGIGVGARGTF